MSESAYAAEANNGVVKLLEWVKQGGVLPEDNDPWKLPKDCPIWKMGLSAFQASWCIAEARAQGEK